MAKVGVSTQLALSTRVYEREGAWLLDSGASMHMTPDITILQGVKQLPAPMTVGVGDGTLLEAKAWGSASFITPHGSFDLGCILWVPRLTANLISVPKLMDKCSMVSKGPQLSVQDTETGVTVMMANKQRNLLHLDVTGVKVRNMGDWFDIRAPTKEELSYWLEMGEKLLAEEDPALHLICYEEEQQQLRGPGGEYPAGQYTHLQAQATAKAFMMRTGIYTKKSVASHKA